MGKIENIWIISRFWLLAETGAQPGTNAPARLATVAAYIRNGKSTRNTEGYLRSEGDHTRCSALPRSAAPVIGRRTYKTSEEATTTACALARLSE